MPFLYFSLSGSLHSRLISYFHIPFSIIIIIFIVVFCLGQHFIAVSPFASPHPPLSPNLLVVHNIHPFIQSHPPSLLHLRITVHHVFAPLRRGRGGGGGGGYKGLSPPPLLFVINYAHALVCSSKQGDEETIY